MEASSRSHCEPEPTRAELPKRELVEPTPTKSETDGQPKRWPPIARVSRRRLRRYSGRAAGIAGAGAKQIQSAPLASAALMAQRGGRGDGAAMSGARPHKWLRQAGALLCVAFLGFVIIQVGWLKNQVVGSIRSAWGIDAPVSGAMSSLKGIRVVNPSIEPELKRSVVNLNVFVRRQGTTGMDVVVSGSREEMARKRLEAPPYMGPAGWRAIAGSKLISDSRSSDIGWRLPIIPNPDVHMEILIGLNNETMTIGKGVVGHRHVGPRRLHSQINGTLSCTSSFPRGLSGFPSRFRRITRDGYAVSSNLQSGLFVRENSLRQRQQIFRRHGRRFRPCL